MNNYSVDRPVPLKWITDEAHPIAWGFTVHDAEGEEYYDMHYEWEMGVVLSGKMTRYWAGHKQATAAGDIWFTGLWESHGYRVEEAPCSVAVFFIRPEVLSTVSLGFSETLDFQKPFLYRPCLRPRTDDNNRQRILDLAGSWKGISDYKEKTAGHLATLRFLEILTLLMDKWSPPALKKAIVSPARIKAAVDLALAGDRPVSEQQAADTCSMSLSTFQRHFKAAMGMNFARFALNVRLKGAAERLRNSSVPIKTLALDAGFQDLSHFYKTFRKAFQQTPAEYRNNG